MTSLLSGLLSSLHKDLNDGQRAALELMAGDHNVFVTGGAGTGKSYLLRKFLHNVDAVKFPVLASTGAAAVLVGGRTFHSFFGLGILEGGAEATLLRALKDKRVIRRLKKATGFVLDEVSMIPGQALELAERIASGARSDPRPWGGLKVIAVGDFAQLPPVSRDSRHRDWAFLNPAWLKTEFKSVQLKEIMRSRGDPEFSEILADIRIGQVTQRVKNMLDWHQAQPADDTQEASVLYAKKIDVERINLQKLSALPGESHFFETEYAGDEKMRKALIANAPVPEKIEIKKGALVMIRQNDPRGRWVNGSLGHIAEIDEDLLGIDLLNGTHVEIERTRFTMLNAEGVEVASAKNFPIHLAYAITIHKAQGATLDRAVVSLRRLWEPGQAYVALSRVRSASSLIVEGWEAASIFADPAVLDFHRSIAEV